MKGKIKNIKDRCMNGIEDGTPCSPMKVPVPGMTEKKNYCDEDGKCGATCIEEQMGCEFYAPMETLYVRNCLSLVVGGNCVHPQALIAKWEELKNEKESNPYEKT